MGEMLRALQLIAEDDLDGQDFAFGFDVYPCQRQPVLEPIIVSALEYADAGDPPFVLFTVKLQQFCPMVLFSSRFRHNASSLEQFPGTEVAGRMYALSIFCSF